jgi:hypothetical protein
MSSNLLKSSMIPLIALLQQGSKPPEPYENNDLLGLGILVGLAVGALACVKSGDKSESGRQRASASALWAALAGAVVFAITPAVIYQSPLGIAYLGAD